MKIRRRPSSALLASLTLALAALTASPPAGATTQWKWRDASGAIQYSDRPPPAGTPDGNILARPLGGRAIQVKAASQAEAAASTPATAKGPESELDAKRRKAEEEKAANQKAEEEKNAKVRADNCQQARNYQRTLNDGVRVSRTNNQGEREILDDKGRAEELKRTQEAIAANCK